MVALTKLITVKRPYAKALKLGVLECILTVVENPYEDSGIILLARFIQRIREKLL